MGDFCQGLDIAALPEPIQLGIENHRSIDRFTDNHSLVRELKGHLPEDMRRYSGIIADVVFDHFLALHWQDYSEQAFTEFRTQSYQQLLTRIDLMPERMQLMVQRMTSQDWLSGYQHLNNIDRALNGIGMRMRFANPLHRAIEPVKENYQIYQSTFAAFFPELLKHVDKQNIEGARKGTI